jgi:hypothetical protein
MTKNKNHRFGFMVPELVARKFYALLSVQRESNVKVSATKMFEFIVNMAFEALPPEAKQKLEGIHLEEVANE